MLNSPDTLRFHLSGLDHGIGIHSIRATSPCLIVEILATQAKQDCEMLSSPDTLRFHLSGLDHGIGIHSIRATSPCLIVEILSTAPSSFVHQIFLVSSVALWFGLNL